jgi:hypothetical protein
LTLPCQKFTEILTEGDGYLNDEDMFGYEGKEFEFHAWLPPADLVLGKLPLHFSTSSIYPLFNSQMSKRDAFAEP